MQPRSITVSQLNKYIGRVLSTDPILMNVAVRGELSKITRNQSGHWYFDLKDSSSKIRCFLHASRVPYIRYEISEGLEVNVFGSVNVYEAGGSYSIYVNDIQAEGEGALAAAFENLKKKLRAEGIFDEEHKKPLPAFPRNIGVVTSPTGAAIRDIINTLRRRDPMVNVLLYPAQVQGEGSAATVCEGIKFFNEKRPETDIIIVGRGGGSAEDLWTFNEESVARAIYASAIPVISAVGHETDNVISDLAADVRAATPTAAAELASVHIENIKDRIAVCSPQNCFSLLSGRLDHNISMCERYIESADNAVISLLSGLSSRLSLAKLDLDSLNPLSVLGNGYAAVKDADGGWITTAKAVRTGDRINVVFKDGAAYCSVEEVTVNG